MSEKPRDAHNILEEAHTISEETRKAHEEGLFQTLEQRVFKPLFNVNYEVGTQNISEGENQMSYTETELSKDDKERLARYIASQDKNTAEGGNFSDENNWHATDQLIYKIGETNLDIFSYLPNGYKILFYPNSKVYNGAIDSENKIIYITSDISSLGGIATILHEVGHAKDDEHLKKLGETKFTIGGNWEENRTAEQLRKEKEASLFALRKLWKELRKNEQTKKDMLLYLKNMAYYSYCAEGLQHITIARAIAHGSPYDHDLDIAEELNREQYDAWDKFKKSDEYQAWKNMEEFSQLDEFEQYGAWCEWIEKKGHRNISDDLI